jgi:hypothetical protein
MNPENCSFFHHDMRKVVGNKRSPRFPRLAELSLYRVTNQTHFQLTINNKKTIIYLDDLKIVGLYEVTDNKFMKI